MLHANGEFAPSKILIELMHGGPVVNLASANEHVPEIERRIRVVKERSRGSRHSLPFQRIPKLLTIHIVLKSVRMLNFFFPTRGGISDSFSPKTIMSGEVLDYKKHLRLQIGQYCQVHEEELPRNSQVARIKGALSLGSSGHLQGGFKLMALNTEKKITRRNLDAIPMLDLVIACVNVLRIDQLELLTFTDRHGRLIGDVGVPGNLDDLEQEDDNVEIPGVNPILDDDVEIPGVDGAEGPEDPAP